MSVHSARAALMRAAILDEMRAADQALRADLLAELGRGGRRDVYEPGTQTGPDDPGLFLGQAYVTNPKPKFVIADEDAFLEWAHEHAEHAVQEVVTYRVSRAFTDQVLKDGYAVAERVNPVTGEVTSTREVPDGIKTVTGKPALTVKPSPDARRIARERLTEVGQVMARPEIGDGTDG